MPDRTSAQTVRRAMQALKLIASGTSDGMRLADVAKALNFERPTAHRLLKALVAEGMLTQHPGSRRYALGSLVFELGLNATHQFNLVDICRPTLNALAEQTGDTTFLFVRSGNDAVCLARVQGPYPIQTPAVPVGARQPLGVNAGGLALLSALSEREALEITQAVAPRLTIYGNLSPEHIMEHWTKAQASGYALIGNRAVPGVTAMGLPVINEKGKPIAAITVAATNSRMTQERIDEILPLLRLATEALSRKL
ncbi:IclR family transcriptional regulator [Pusillimonas sp. NJUB218]|uniref:IclR family transcriptional regulator n=1 Tax=Pusillimonas sp. NJUB218 TaxID=2023230 RepID=UPI000F4BC2B6|nr:IclR family transcriptional regulator [Pusillimonas sp. NJUB218]ROT44066.1 IclR family transcriptional regulator [Pusillimonas sp. NJUB218]